MYTSGTELVGVGQVKRADRNYLVFVALFIFALLQLISGFVLWWVLPAGEGYQGGRGLAGENAFLWDRYTWIDLHGWVAVALLVVVIIHLVLHWKWLARMTRRYLNRLRGRHTGNKRDLNARRHPRRAARPG